MSDSCTNEDNVLVLFQSIELFTGHAWRGDDRLELNAVHLWGINLDGSPPCLERCVQWLDKEERHRASRLIREEDRQRYIFAHGGLRAVLGRYLGVGPDAVAMDRSETGKPSLTRTEGDRRTITFNMSHAYGRALIAVAQGQDIGVDLERIRPDMEVVKLSARYFAHDEHATIMQLAPDERAARFFRYWVGKEAVLKAQGIGLQALSRCEIHLSADGVGAQALVSEGAPLQDNWTIRFLSCGQDWEAAVAAKGVDWVVQCGSAGN